MALAGALDSTRLTRFRRKLTLFSAVGMFLDGFDLTVIAVALPVLKTQWQISGVMLGVVSCSAIVGMLVGALVLGRLTDLIGRRAMYMIDLIAFVVFAALTAASQNVWELVIFRFLLGIGIGADYPISSTLTSEFGARHDRGRLVVALSLMWNVGALAAYVAGIVLLPSGPNSWRWMLLLGAVLALITFFFRATIPESPRWLRAHGRAEEAERIVARLTGGAVEVERVETKRKEPWLRLFSRGLVASTVFVCTFWFAHGVAYYGVQMYTPTILETLTGSSQLLAYVGAAIIALLGIGGAVISMSLVEGWGRRPVIITAFIGEAAVLILLALLGSTSLAIVIGLFSIAILFSNMGPGTLDFVYCTELFPTGLRAAGTGLGSAVSRVGAILGVLVFPGLVTSWGVSKALWLFVGAALLGVVVSVVLAPETKGRSLEETSGEQVVEPAPQEAGT